MHLISEHDSKAFISRY